MRRQANFFTIYSLNYQRLQCSIAAEYTEVELLTPSCHNAGGGWNSCSSRPRCGWHRGGRCCRDGGQC